jgi:hypothetical protein
MGFIFFACVLAVPFYYVWNELAPIYFTWVPPLFQHLPFWHCVGLFFLLAVTRFMLLPTGWSGHQFKYIAGSRSRGGRSD